MSLFTLVLANIPVLDNAHCISCCMNRSIYQWPVVLTWMVWLLLVSEVLQHHQAMLESVDLWHQNHFHGRVRLYLTRVRTVLSLLLSFMGHILKSKQVSRHLVPLAIQVRWIMLVYLWITESSWELSAELNVSGTFTLLLFVDVKFLTRFWKYLKYFNVKYKTSPNLVVESQSVITKLWWGSSTADIFWVLVQHLQSVMLDIQFFLQSWLIPHKKHSAVYCKKKTLGFNPKLIVNTVCFNFEKQCIGHTLKLLSRCICKVFVIFVWFLPKLEYTG